MPTMFIPSLDKIERVLRLKGVDVATLTSNPKNIEQAVGIVYGSSHPLALGNW